MIKSHTKLPSAIGQLLNVSTIVDRSSTVQNVQDDDPKSEASGFTGLTLKPDNTPSSDSSRSEGRSPPK